MARSNSDRGSDPDSASREGLRRAVEGWREIAGSDQPIDGELLTGGHHATVVHLWTGDRSGRSAVAKIRPRGGLDLERRMHEAILPELGVATPEFLGFASGRPGNDGESDVLFLEYVGAIEFEPFASAHQEAAARWLGHCHAASARASIPAIVPRRSLDEDRGQLSTIRSQLSATLDNRVLGAEGGSLVSGVLELLDSAARRWSEWAELTASVPRVLTHGAFITRNVRMRTARDRLVTLPFDWDHVSVGSPAIDLARMSGRTRGFAANASLGPYREALAAHGLSLEPGVVAALATLGTLIRSVACIGWLIGGLASDFVDSPLAELELYRQALDRALRA